MHVRCRHSDIGHTRGSVPIGRRFMRIGRSEMRKSQRSNALLVGHGEDAVPPGWRFVEEIFLAALPIGAGWTVVGPFVQNDLERSLRVLPTALAVELVGLLKEGDALAHFAWGAISRVLRSAANKLVDGHRSEEHTSELQSPVHLVC